jgi:hypothetical protein
VIIASRRLFADPAEQAGPDSLHVRLVGAEAISRWARRTSHSENSR